MRVCIWFWHPSPCSKRSRLQKFTNTGIQTSLVFKTWCDHRSIFLFIHTEHHVLRTYNGYVCSVAILPLEMWPMIKLHYPRVAFYREWNESRLGRTFKDTSRTLWSNSNKGGKKGDKDGHSTRQNQPEWSRKPEAVHYRSSKKKEVFVKHSNV